jgi:tight adherence protein C
MLIAVTFDSGTVAMLAAFICFSILGWVVTEMSSRRRRRAEERLEQLRDTMLPSGGGASSKKVASLLEKAAENLSRPLESSNEKDVNNLKVQLANAGFRSEFAPTAFRAVKFGGMVFGFFLGGGTLALLTGTIDVSVLTKAGIAGLILFFVPELILRLLASSRKGKIFLGLPDALDLMVVCVEAGLGLDQAMRKVSDEMKKTHPVISEEFGLCNMQLQMGRGRSEVLQELGVRSGVDDLKSLASIIIQADKFGSSIAKALRVQSDAMRTRRKQLAEEKAAKTAVKLIFPLVLFIFPGIFVVLVGPAAITMIREMLPAMGGN